jgi:hypothetical protein
MIRRLLICATVIGALSIASQSANAQYGGGFGGGCGDWGYGYGYLYNILRYEVPHFAAFPPVYYSAPVPRTYGYSPFAYPPNVMTPEIVGEIEPMEIINPHVESSEVTPTKKTKSDRTAATSARIEPLVVINPFVAPNQAVAQVDR